MHRERKTARRKHAVILMVGPQGHGKSTFVNRLLDNECRVVSSDDIRMEFAKEFGMTYDEVFNSSLEYAARVRYQEALQQAFCDKVPTIIIDRMNHTVSARNSVLSRTPKTTKRIAVSFDPVQPDSADWPVIRDRLLARKDKYIPFMAYVSAVESFVRPTLDEGFDAIIHVDPISGAIDIEGDLQIAEMVLPSIRN